MIAAARRVRNRSLCPIAHPPRWYLQITRVRREWQERLLLALCAGVLVWQLFVPGFIGMADNGDFGKVAGPLSLGGVDHGADHFVFFQPHYFRSPQNYFIPEPPSSEIALAALASTCEKPFDADYFDIRWLGALHALLFLGFFAALLQLLRPCSALRRLSLGLLAIWIFADAGTLAYFNSFYMDAAAALGALLACALAARCATVDRPRSAALALLSAAALLFATAKGQHALVGLILAATVMAVALSVRLPMRAAIASAASLVIAGSIGLLLSMPPWYRAQSRFDLIFSFITPRSATPAADLEELGLSSAHLRFSGSNAFSPGTPMAQRAFVDDFDAHCTYARILAFYARHPAVAAAKLWSDLTAKAALRRPANLSNFPRTQGKPPGARTRRLASWSALRSALFAWWPAHILIWYAFAIGWFGWRAFHGLPLRRARAAVIVTIAWAGILEFAVAALADAVETDRHLFLFHLLTDVTIFFAALWWSDPAPQSKSPV